MIHSRPPETDIAANLEYLNDKIGGLAAIEQSATSDVISIGRYGGLVDMPNTEGQASRKDNSSGKIAPKIITYTAKQIIFWREDDQLQEVRLLEEYEIPDEDGINYECKTQIRRLVLIDGIYHNQVWRKNELYMENTPVMNGSMMDFIPFAFYGADNNKAELGAIPLYDLGAMNLGHFMLDADNRDNLHYHGQGMTNVFTDSSDEIARANPNGLDVGAKGRNQFNQGDRVEILQIDATGAIPAEMLRDEARMVQAGAQVVTENNASETLGAKVIDTNANTSTLKQIAINGTNWMETLLNWCSMFLGDANPDNKYELNTQFVTDDMDYQTLLAHFQLVQGGKLPNSTLYESARKAGLTNKTDEEIEAEVGEEAMNIAGTDEQTATLLARIEALESAANGDDA